MDKQQLATLLDQSELLDATSTQQLEAVIEQYPFFQAARALQLKGLKQQESYAYNDALKITAAYTSDREVLFDFITSDIFINQDTSTDEIAALDVLEATEYDPDKEAWLALKQELQEQLETNQVNTMLDSSLRDSGMNAGHYDIDKYEFNKETPATSDVEEILKHQEKPLEFDNNEKHSFAQWLKLTAISPIPDRLEEIAEKQERTELQLKMDRIDAFLAAKPKIVPQKTESKNINLASQSSTASDSLMTETLASVYIAQNQYDKAIQAYRILILKNPQKSGFFADQIRRVEKLKNPN